MQTTSNKAAVIHEMTRDISYIDPDFPRWARRNHPIVKRYLGVHWRVIPPQSEPVIQWLVMQTVIIVATIPFPFLLTVVVPLALVSLAVLPVALFYYARALFEIATESAKTMTSEVENSTLNLLLSTPMEVREVLLSKMAAVVWMQSETLTMLLMAAGLTQLPTLMILYITRYPVENGGIEGYVLMVLALISSVIRLPLEMLAVSVVGQYIGITTRGRSAAAASAASVVFFYFVLINALRFLNLPFIWMALVEIVLPVLIPPLAILITLKLVTWEIEQL